MPVEEGIVVKRGGREEIWFAGSIVDLGLAKVAWCSCRVKRLKTMRDKRGQWILLEGSTHGTTSQEDGTSGTHRPEKFDSTDRVVGCGLLECRVGLWLRLLGASQETSLKQA